MLNLIAQSEASFWMPPRVSTFANGVDWLFYGIYWLSVVMSLLVTIIALTFVWKYRARPGHGPQKSPSHSTALELTWTIIPIIVMVVIFYAGFRSFMNIVTPRPNPYPIYVEGKKWAWSFTYPNGAVSNELVVPKDRPIELIMQSPDVIHSLFIPVFRVKKDVVPGRFNKMWFQATEMGEYDLFCAEYCGTQHSKMVTKVKVIDPSNFTAWLDEAANFAENMPPAEAGARLVGIHGCNQCHSVDGSRLVGPSLKDLWGKEETMTNGSTVVVDENYIAQSLTDPAAQIVRGFRNEMPTYQGRLKPNEIAAIVEYIKSVSEGASHAESWDQLGGSNGGESDEPDDAEAGQTTSDDTTTEGSQP